MQKLLDKTYRFLSYRPRSEREIRNYLKKKNASDEIVQKIVKKLKKLRLIDDLVFCRWWIEQRITFRPRGKFALQVELRQKGIDSEMAKKVIEAMVDEVKLAKKVIQGKKANRQKLSALLARRGFSWEIIRQVLKE